MKKQTKEYFIEYRKKNRSKVKKYYQLNRERIIKYAKEWRVAHLDQYRKNQRSAQARFSQSVKGIFRNLKFNSKRKKRDFCLNQEEFIEWYFNQVKVCFYCNIPEQYVYLIGSRRLEIDRMDNSLPYSIENIILACHWCNNVKSNTLTCDEMKLVGEIVIKRKWSKLL